MCCTTRNPRRRPTGVHLQGFSRGSVERPRGGGQGWLNGKYGFVDCHGAYGRVGKTEPAYYHRDLQYDFLILSSWPEEAEAEKYITWTREFFAAMRPNMRTAFYVNDLGADEGAEGIRGAYGGNYERLAALKQKYDPTNFFRMNQNITPSA